ncbi:MAG: metallophosphoesterase [Bdellovibrionaceae bacterium]|nr:metallophosphoesterase [Pseudobdellovibrionaceae bacterium]
MSDFKTAKLTAIVSDLHLTEEEPVNLRFPLWKKYKTREFFFDKEFAEFLNVIDKKAKKDSVELILNGDIFDFDSVCALPEKPSFYISWLEKKRGLHPQEDKSVFKFQRIFKSHPVWFSALSNFIKKGHRVVFIIGNHDLELHFPKVQESLIVALQLEGVETGRIQFAEWFYLSNQDTLVEHGNQYDPYCLSIDPVSPFVQKYNKIEVRIPFGNLTTRYLINGMGFFNPYLESNFIMSAGEYVKFFFKYIIRTQPFLMFSWIWGSTVVLIQSFLDYLLPPLMEPLEIEGRIEQIAARSNATPRMVREMRSLTVASATSRPLLILRELWLDRAFLFLLMFLLFLQLFFVIDQIYDISFYWVLIPFTLFMPFFIFYSRSVSSSVHLFKEPKEKILTMASLITGASRIIYGHTHIYRHEIIGPVEHLNSGTWSPAFEDVECKSPMDQKTFIWIEPENDIRRKAKLYKFDKGKVIDVFGNRGGRMRRAN